MVAYQFPAASRLICSIAVGKHTGTRPIRLSTRLCFTCLSREAIGRFSHGDKRTGTCRRYASIPRLCRRCLNANVPLARPGRCQAQLKDLPEERVHGVLDAAAQFRLRQKANRIRKKIDAHGRDETLFQEMASAHYSLAELVSWGRRTSTFIRNRRANMCGSYGTVGGRIGIIYGD